MKGLLIKKVFTIVGFIFLLALLFIALKIVVFRLYTVNNIKVDGESIVYERPKGMERTEPTKWNSISAVETEATLVNNISIYHEGKRINGKIYEKDQRYYVNFKGYIEQIGGKLKTSEGKEILQYNDKNIEIHFDKELYSKKYEALKFRGEILTINNKKYVSINDIESMLDLRDTWDNKKRKIYIYNDKKYVDKPIVCKSGKASLIRFEKVVAGTGLKGSEAKEKFKIIADNLYSKGVKFHVSWVPRYKDPSKDIDNNLLTNKTMDNAQFINMLDHLIQKGGVIGLNGYTHQSGDETSLKGNELTGNINEDETRRVLESAIITAKSLRIPISFFQSPNYASSRKQQRIIEEYFNILYEPYKGYYNVNPLYSFRDKKRLYVPTMYGGVEDKHGESMVKQLKGKGNFVLKSLYIHPFMEIGFVNLKDEDEKGYRDYTYDRNSPLNNVIKALDESGYITISVNNF